MDKTSARPPPVEPNQWDLRVELRRFTSAEDQVLVAEDETHPPGEDVEPFEPVVGAWGGVGLGGGDDDLPGLDAARTRERQHRPPVHPPWLQPDARVTDLRCPPRSSSGTRYVCTSGNSSSRLGLRCPVYSRDSVDFDI